MSDIAIQVEHLSKRYRLGLKEELPDTLMGAMTSWLTAPVANFRQLRRLNTFSQNGHDDPDILYALKDVSFEIKQSEVVGIIGRNGAGKSTLLKILSRIVEPTSGRAVINGRVASLLEVGTGFHPDLTGRENVYLNGTVLGMTKREIDRKFDEIVDFSGVEQFIDTPVKRYSSGMQVRLAFAVAAHLEPEILMVDEVLAVGDIAFQKKCMGKMEEVSQRGRTVLFVSHNMAAIQQLCGRVIYLEAGKIVTDGLTKKIVGIYYENVLSSPDSEDIRVHDKSVIKSAALCLDRDTHPTGFVDYRESIVLNIEIETNDQPIDVVIELAGFLMGIKLFGMTSSNFLQQEIHVENKTVLQMELCLGQLQTEPLVFDFAIRIRNGYVYHAKQVLTICPIPYFETTSVTSNSFIVPKIILREYYAD